MRTKFFFYFSIILFGMFALTWSACKKDVAVPEKDPETKTNVSFAFGINVSGWCLENCTTIYGIHNQQLYPVTFNSGRYIVDGEALGHDKYLLAVQLQNEIPDYMKVHPDTIYGCPGCADGSIIHVAQDENGTKRSWVLDMPGSNNQPEPVSEYSQKIIDILKELEN